MRLPFRLSMPLIALSILLIPTAVFATPVSGTFDIGGSNATVTALTLSFFCNPALTGAPCPAPVPDNGNFTVVSGSGDFSSLAGQGGYIENLNNTIAPPGPAFSPALMGWITFAGGADIQLNLNQVFEGVSGSGACGASPAPGQICTPVIPGLGTSPYNLQNLGGGGSSASFAVGGMTERISTGEMSPFVGTFTANFNVPYQTLLAEIASGGSITNSYSATFNVTTVPEPATSALIIGGLLMGLGLGSKRLRRRA